MQQTRPRIRRYLHIQVYPPGPVNKYTGVLAAADVCTKSTTFWVMESIRLDLGFASYVHP
jgi:hypothetical protein